MAIKKAPCKNHPDKHSAKRCFHCKDHICSDCQLHLSHHLFCGNWCYLKWQVSNYYKQFKLSPQFVFLFSALILSNLLIIIYFDLKISDFENRQKIDVQTESSVDSTVFKPARIDTSRLKFRHAIDIQVETENGMVVGLWRDGKFITTIESDSKPIIFPGQYLESGSNHFSIWQMNGDGNMALIDSFKINFSSSRIDYLSKYITKVKNSGKSLALTFDGGSIDSGTEPILEILRNENVACTMFLTGTFIKKYPYHVLTMISDGHEIGNHSYNHPHLTNLEIDGTTRTRENINRERLYNQLQMTDSLFFEVTGKHTIPYWRAPYGELNREILRWAAEAGYKHIGWSERCDTWDWVADTSSTLYRSNGEILEHILEVEEKSGLEGKILLMHLGTEREYDFPYLTLQKMIQQLKERGYRFLRISELIQNSNDISS